MPTSPLVTGAGTPPDPERVSRTIRGALASPAPPACDDVEAVSSGLRSLPVEISLVA